MKAYFYRQLSLVAKWVFTILAISLLVLLLIFLGIWIGASAAKSEQDSLPAATETVTVTATEVHNHLPESCSKALDMALRLRNAAANLDAGSGVTLDVLDEAGMLISEQDIPGLNKLSDRQRLILNQTTESAGILHSQISVFDRIMTQCQLEIAN